MPDTIPEISAARQRKLCSIRGRKKLDEKQRKNMELLSSFQINTDRRFIMFKSGIFPFDNRNQKSNEGEYSN